MIGVGETADHGTPAARLRLSDVVAEYERKQTDLPVASFAESGTNVPTCVFTCAA